MKVIKIALALIILMTSTLSWGDENPRRDGNWWRQTDKNTRYSFVLGYFDGMELGLSFACWKYSSPPEKNSQEFNNCINLTYPSFQEFQTKYFSKVTNGQMADGLDRFYADFKNRSILVQDALWIVAREIAGIPKGQLNEMILNYRKNASNEK